MTADSKAEPGMNDSSPTATMQSPFCGSLRSKKFFMIDGLGTQVEDYLDASNHCWCRQTQQVVGPDGSQVDPHRCVPGRSCYSSALESI
jgi:hypothetical protein